MKPRLSLILGLGAALTPLLLPSPASAQEDQPSGFATYYYCNQATEARADTIMSEHYAAMYDKHLAAGNITAWGWLSHRIGGKWRRLSYFFAPSRDALLDARAALISDFQADDSGTDDRHRFGYFFERQPFRGGNDAFFVDDHIGD